MHGVEFVIGEIRGGFMADTKGYAALLLERMRLLGLSPAAVDGVDRNVMAHLHGTCSSCALKARCARDLASGGEAVAAYCPNDERLENLRLSTRRP
jgi:hypothetical protein